MIFHSEISCWWYNTNASELSAIRESASTQSSSCSVDWQIIGNADGISRISCVTICISSISGSVFTLDRHRYNTTIKSNSDHPIHQRYHHIGRSVTSITYQINIKRAYFCPGSLKNPPISNIPVITKSVPMSISLNCINPISNNTNQSTVIQYCWTNSITLVIISAILQSWDDNQSYQLLAVSFTLAVVFLTITT